MAVSLHAQQSAERGADPLFPQILKQMATAPAQRPSAVAMKGLHAMPGEGTAQVSPGDTHPLQRPRRELRRASEVMQSCAQARRTGKRPPSPSRR